MTKWVVALTGGATAIATLVAAATQVHGLLFPEPVEAERDSCVQMIEVLGTSLSACVQRLQ